ncbi:MAG: aminoacyl-tRNA hydrolase [Patescibacteria group bacterium]
MPLLIVGLGNPGKDYINTRHNAGFLAVDALATALQARWKLDKAAHSDVIETTYFDQKIILAKPQTFMNLSGVAVAHLMRKFKLTPDQVWIIADDIALPLGTIRLRTGGSAGGHNGLKSIIEKLATENFVRLKLGIDSPPANIPLENYVIQTFSKAEQTSLIEVIHRAKELILHSIAHGPADISVQI